MKTIVVRGKSKFADKVFVYDPFFYFLENPQQGSVKVLYFTREMSKEDKMMEFYSHLLYRLSNKSIRISPVDLKSTRADKPVPQEVLVYWNLRNIRGISTLLPIQLLSLMI